MTVRIPAVLLALILPLPAVAATLVETKSDGGLTHRMWIEGARLRAEQTGEPGYVLIDAKQRSMVLVNTQEKEVVEMSGFLREGGGKPPSVSVKLNAKGAGPKVAGYATTHYEVLANGKKCSDEFLSKDALKAVDSSVLEAFDTFSGMGDMGPMMEQMIKQNPCLAAEAQLGAEYRKLGYPLKVIDADGRTTDEVTAIVEKAPLPAGGFDIPKGYRTVDAKKQMEEAMSNVPAMPQGQQGMDPEAMQRMLEQLQKQMQGQ